LPSILLSRREIYEDETSLTAAVQDCSGNIYLTTRDMLDTTDLIITLIHELGHIKFNRSTPSLLELSPIKLDYNSGRYIDKCVYGKYVSDFKVSINSVTNKIDHKVNVTDSEIKESLTSFFTNKKEKEAKLLEDLRSGRIIPQFRSSIFSDFRTQVKKRVVEHDPIIKEDNQSIIEDNKQQHFSYEDHDTIVKTVFKKYLDKLQKRLNIILPDTFVIPINTTPYKRFVIGSHIAAYVYAYREREKCYDLFELEQQELDKLKLI
jgi:hypothetical protein